MRNFELVMHMMWGKGYTPEAATKVLDILFDEVGANCVYAGHDVNNPNSGRVMQKIGMKYEGILRQFGKNNQGIVDCARYSQNSKTEHCRCIFRKTIF